MMNWIKAFGKGLRRLRKRRRITLEELSRRSGINKKHIIRIEKGKCKAGPRFLTLVKLAEAFEVNIFAFFQEIERLLGKGEGIDMRQEFLKMVAERAEDGLVEINTYHYARDLSVGRTTIKRYLEWAKEQKLLRRHKPRTGRGNGTIYRLTKRAIKSIPQEERESSGCNQNLGGRIERERIK